METELKTRWVEALRSGKYRQASGLLRCHVIEDDETAYDGFCCLGVLKDLVDPDGWVRDMGEDEDEWRHGDLGDRNFPSTTFLESVGFGYSDARFLAGKNDDGVSFSDIAQMIENDEFEDVVPYDAE